MTDAKNFVVQEWHVIALFLTIVGGIFKTEITSALQSIVITIEQKALIGQTVEMQSPDGSWHAVKIISYECEIPFFRTGGVLLEHQLSGNDYIQEKINFDNWSNQRIRTLQS